MGTIIASMMNTLMSMTDGYVQFILQEEGAVLFKSFLMTE